MDAATRRLWIAAALIGVTVFILLILLVALPSGGGAPSGSAPNAVFAVPRWVLEEHLPRSALPGANLFVSAGCTACHTYAGSGRSNLKAPDLTRIGSRHPDIAFLIRYLRCPFCVNPASRMPAFASLGHKRLRQLAVFLEDSKGTR
jgi:cbb3-type cytochrome oxidase cytochrome c subunit